MKIKEVKAYLENHNLSEWFSKLEIPVKFDSDDFEKKFNGFLSFYRFIFSQVNKFEKLSIVEENKNINPCKIRFLNTLNALDRFIESFDGNHTENQMTIYWNRTIANSLKQLNTNLVLRADSPRMIFLENVHSNYPNAATHAYQFFTNQNTTNNSRDALIGRNLAYEFMVAEFSDIMGRKKIERDRLLEFINEFEGRVAEIDSDFEKHLVLTTKKSNSFAENISNLEGSKRKEIDSLISEKIKSFATVNNDALKKITALENAYGEKLRLSKPAQYWKKRSTDLKDEAWRTTYIMIFITLLIAISLYFLLWKTPEGMILSYSENNSSAIKWTILYITFLSSLVFIVRGLYKLAFSAFHLARDAEEREQLMHVYLSMVKEESIAEEDRQLIIQSLFSRADTGLLKEDSGPTMPTSIINKVISGK